MTALMRLSLLPGLAKIMSIAESDLPAPGVSWERNLMPLVMRLKAGNVKSDTNLKGQLLVIPTNKS